LRDVEGANIREIIFFGYMESYRIVRNNNEVANFDITIRQSDYDTNIVCPVISITNTIDYSIFGGIFSIDYSFGTNNLVTEYTVQLLDASNEVVFTETYTSFGETITATFSPVDPDTLYSIKTLVDGLEDLVCPGTPFLSFNVPCPVPSLEVGENFVNVTIEPDPLITRVSVQLLDSIDPINILDVETLDAPFPDPYTTIFGGLDTETQYWIRNYQRIISDGVVQYAKFCAVVPFTTGTPYVPPTAFPYDVRFGALITTVCEGLELTIYSDSETLAPGSQLYYDEDLTNPADNGFDFITFDGLIYTFDGDTGIIGSLTEETCE
jgi:hypothetical protein